MQTMTVLFLTKDKTFLFFAKVPQDNNNNHISMNKLESLVKYNQKPSLTHPLSLHEPSTKLKNNNIEYMKARIANI